MDVKQIGNFLLLLIPLREYGILNSSKVHEECVETFAEAIYSINASGSLATPVFNPFTR